MAAERGRVYLSARFGRRDELRAYRRDLESIEPRVGRPGWVCCTSWLDAPGEIDAAGRNVIAGVAIESVPLQASEMARIDLQDVARADVLIAFSDGPHGAPGSGRGGRHVELGFALALGVTVALVGPEEHVFHYIKGMHLFESWPSALRWLADYAGGNDRLKEAIREARVPLSRLF